MSEFPEGFLWGSATAAHQVEGGCTGNDWWAWEHDPASGCVEPSGDAIDQYHRYDSDFALLAALGQRAHRISLEWSRIEPAPGEFSAAALDHYARVLDSLARHGLTAFVTLHHFTLPAWFPGWRAPDAVELFARYVRVVVGRLGHLVPFFCTVNEPQVVAVMGYGIGVFPPGLQDHEAAVEVNATLMRAHRAAVAEVRACPAQVGVCLQLPLIEPLTPADSDVADLVRWVMVDSHLDDLRAGGDVGDYLGLQYYTRMRIGGDLSQASPPDGAETTQMGWEVHPAGFGTMLRQAATAGLPLVVTENGIATADDDQRVRYLRSHLGVLRDAMADGVDVRGYLHWSAFDNFEWAHGYAPTFGLIGIDRADGLRRVVRRSAVLYGEVARTGSLAALG